MKWLYCVRLVSIGMLFLCNSHATKMSLSKAIEILLQYNEASFLKQETLAVIDCTKAEVIIPKLRFAYKKNSFKNSPR